MISFAPSAAASLARGLHAGASPQADRQRLLNLYAKRGRYNVHRSSRSSSSLDQNRVDVVFQIHEGPRDAQISRIAFVGNHAFSEDRLKEVVDEPPGSVLALSVDDTDNYDPERINFDKELLRRFYLKNGFADVDRSPAPRPSFRRTGTAFFITFTMERRRALSGSAKSAVELAACRNLDGQQRCMPLTSAGGVKAIGTTATPSSATVQAMD